MNQTVSYIGVGVSCIGVGVLYIGEGPGGRGGPITDNMDFILSSLLLLKTLARTVRVLKGIRHGNSMILFILVHFFVYLSAGP